MGAETGSGAVWGGQGRADHKSITGAWSAGSECSVGTFWVAVWPPGPTGWGKTTGGVLCTPGQPPDELVPIAAWEQVPALGRARANVALGHPAPPRRLHLLHRGARPTRPGDGGGEPCAYPAPVGRVWMLSVAGINNSSANALP